MKDVVKMADRVLENRIEWSLLLVFDCQSGRLNKGLAFVVEGLGKRVRGSRLGRGWR
jgi:hypothetical protein